MYTVMGPFQGWIDIALLAHRSIECKAYYVPVETGPAGAAAGRANHPAAAPGNRPAPAELARTAIHAL